MFGDDPTLVSSIASGATGSSIASLMQTAIRAYDDAYTDATVTHHGSDTASYFSIRGLPSDTVTLTGGNALFGASGRGVVSGATISDLIGHTMGFNQRVVASDSDITISTN